MPVATEYVSGIAMTVRNTGMAYSILLQSTSPSPRAINTPTMISAGAVTAGVTTPSSGEKNRASRNSTDVATDVNPVRPPAATPADDSTYAVVVDVPSTAPPIAATGSDTNAARALGSLPSRSRPAWPAMAISVPDVSKKSTNIIVKITTSISPTNRSGKLVMAWPNVGGRRADRPEHRADRAGEPDAVEPRAPHTFRQRQRGGHQPQQRQHGLRATQIAEHAERRVVSRRDLGVSQPDERDERPDPRSGG